MSAQEFWRLSHRHNSGYQPQPEEPINPGASTTEIKFRELLSVCRQAALDGECNTKLPGRLDPTIVARFEAQGFRVFLYFESKETCSACPNQDPFDPTCCPACAEFPSTDIWWYQIECVAGGPPPMEKSS
jgi:hypothetical protein